MHRKTLYENQPLEEIQYYFSWPGIAGRIRIEVFVQKRRSIEAVVISRMVNKGGSRGNVVKGCGFSDHAHIFIDSNMITSA